MIKILIVDDEEVYCTLLPKILAHEGYEVRAIMNGQEAIQIGTSFRPLILIADWRLADEQTGFNVAEALRKVNPGLLVIMITGYAATELEEAATIDRFRVLQKPFRMDEIVTLVREVMMDYEIGS